MKLLLEKWQQFLKEDSTVVTVNIKGVPLELEVAADEQSRNDGLMFRDSLGENSGMLFLFPDSAERSFWMKDTYIPLSIAFIDNTGTITVIKDMAPESLSSVTSETPAQYALEMPLGWFDKHNLLPGHKVLGIPSLENDA